MTYRTQHELIEHIVALRHARNVTQADVASALGIDQSAVSRLERGERGLAVAELATIAEYLGVSTDSILRREEGAVALRATAPDEAVDDAMRIVDHLIQTHFSFAALLGEPA